MSRRHHSHRHRRSGWLWLAVLVVCGAVLAILAVLNPWETPETFGDLDARFASRITLEHDGKTYHYRDNELVNVLVIGVDQGDMTAQRTGYRSGGQADFLLLMAIDRRNKTVSPIQIDRDTIAEIDITGIFGNPAGTTRAQICLAQAFGATVEDSCKNESKAVSRLLGGIPVDYYLALDLSSINLINDALGGVTVKVEEDLTNLDPAMKVGATLTLRGTQAETYVRSRMAVKSDPTNAGRMRRQRNYMISAAEKLTSMLASDAASGLKILEKLDSHVVTNLPQSWIADQLPEYSGYDRLPVWTPVGEHTYGTDGFMEFYPDENAQKNMLIGTFFA